LGDFTPAKAILIESAGALQGRIRGVTDTTLVTRSVDPLYHRAWQMGKLQVGFPETGIPLEVRVGRHLEAVRAICRTLAEFEPEKTIAFSRIPDYDELLNRGVGFFLR